MKAKREKKDGKWTYTIELDAFEMAHLWTCIGAAMIVAEVGPDELDVEHEMLESLKENFQMCDIERFTVDFINNPTFLPHTEMVEEAPKDEDDLPN